MLTTADGLRRAARILRGRGGASAIDAQAMVTPTGPSAASPIAGPAEARGLVLCRDARARNGGSPNEARLNGGAAMRLFGGLYLPTSDVQVNGSGGTAFFTGVPIVGCTLGVSGTADTRADVSGRSNFTAVPQVRTPRLVE